jgi:Tfp pilus assembly protein PilW
MFWKKIKNNKLAGVSLIELMVSVTIFLVILMSMTSIFKMVIDSQREAIATQNVQENLKYFFEVISKEIRMAQRAGGACDHLPANRRFATGSNAHGDILYLRNYHNECVIYDLAADFNGVVRFRVERGSISDFLSPASINISDLNFLVTEEANSQAYVSINLSAHSVGREAEISNMHVQTTIASRYYRPMNP